MHHSPSAESDESTKTVMWHVKLAATRPDYLYVADAPLSMNPTIQRLSIPEIEEKFQFKYCETVVCRDEFNRIDFSGYDGDCSDPVFTE